MPFSIVRNDLAKMNTDAIVVANDNVLAHPGCVGRAVADAAGEDYKKACIDMGQCDTGDALIMDGYDLPAQYVIQTVGPKYRGGHYGEGMLLRSCYEKSLALAKKNGCRSIAFPLIATGGFGYPKEEGLRIASEAIKDFLNNDDNGDMNVVLVVFDRETTLLSRELDDNIEEYIDDNYVGKSPIYKRYHSRGRNIECNAKLSMATVPSSLESALKQKDESFHQMLFRLIDEKGLKNAEVYNNANLSKQHFSKIKNNEDYKPKKETVFALAVAMKLDIEETREFLQKAGYSLSNSFLQDIIVQYFIVHKNYNITDINYALFDHDLVLLGERPL